MNLNWNQLIWNIIRPPDYLETKCLTNVTPAMKSLLMLTLFTLKGNIFTVKICDTQN